MLGIETSTSGIGFRSSVPSSYAVSSTARSSVGGNENVSLDVNAGIGSQGGSNQQTASALTGSSQFENSFDSSQTNPTNSSGSDASKSSQAESNQSDQSQVLSDRNARFNKTLTQIELAFRGSGANPPPSPRQFQQWIGEATLAAFNPDLPGTSDVPTEPSSTDHQASNPPDSSSFGNLPSGGQASGSRSSGSTSKLDVIV
jgi:hypothetical protein